MLTTQLFVIPFFVVGRRLTLSIEIRGRSLDDLPFNGDFIVFDYDSGRDLDRYDDLPTICVEAAKALADGLKQREDSGWPLSKSQTKFRTVKVPSLIWLYEVGYGERASVPELFLNALMDVAD